LVSLMIVFAARLEAIATDHGFPKPTGNEPVAKVAGVILKSMLLFAHPAVGKVRAMSVKAMNRRLILVLRLGRFWPPTR